MGIFFLLKMELYYSRMTEFNVYNRNNFSIHAFLNENVTDIVPRYEYLYNFVIVRSISFATVDVQFPTYLFFKIASRFIYNTQSKFKHIPLEG